MKYCEYCPDMEKCEMYGGCWNPPKEKPLSPSDATPCSPRELAARIATRLFTNGLGDQGERLEIKQATGYEHERSLGGWCYLAALDQIETVILEENSPDQPSGIP